MELMKGSPIYDFWIGQNDGDGKRLRGSGNRNEGRDGKVEGEGSSGKPAEQSSKPPDPPKQDYIHVRARRGQATDSHSLAERVIHSPFNCAVCHVIVLYAFCLPYREDHFLKQDNST